MVYILDREGKVGGILFQLNLSIDIGEVRLDATAYSKRLHSVLSRSRLSES